MLKHKPGTSNRADYLSRLLGVDRSVKNNENVTVLPDRLFARALNLEDLDHEVRQPQGKLSEEWKEQYGLVNSEEGWTRQGQLVVGDTPELCRCLAAAHHDHATAGHPGVMTVRLGLLFSFHLFPFFPPFTTVPRALYLRSLIRSLVGLTFQYQDWIKMPCGLCTSSPIYYMPYPRPYCTIYTHISTC